MKTFTVVCAYTAHGDGPRIFYDCTQARTRALAISKIAPKCPATPTDILVFPGELYDLSDLGAALSDVTVEALL